MKQRRRLWRGGAPRPSARGSGAAEKTPRTPKAPADIRSCAAMLGFRAVRLDAEGWFGLAPVTGTEVSTCIWRAVTAEEKKLLDRTAQGRFFAGHWSIATPHTGRKASAQLCP